MINRKKLFVPVFTVITLFSLLSAVPNVYAQDNGPENNSFFGQIFSKISHFFSGKNNELNEENKGIRPEEMPEATPSGFPRVRAGQANSLEEMYTKLVEEGKITEVQKTAIIAELKVINTKLKALQEELASWAKTQGIDQSFVMQGFPGGMGNMNNIPNGNKPSTPSGAKPNQGGSRQRQLNSQQQNRVNQPPDLGNQSPNQ